MQQYYDLSINFVRLTHLSFHIPPKSMNSAQTSIATTTQPKQASPPQATAQRALSCHQQSPSPLKTTMTHSPQRLSNRSKKSLITSLWSRWVRFSPLNRPHSIKMTHLFMIQSEHDMWQSMFICNSQHLNMGLGPNLQDWT